MKKQFPITSKYPVYPGEYIHMPETEALLRSLQTHQNASMPLLNVEELKDCYTIEVFIPGTKREDIFLNIDKNILFIVALQNSEYSMNDQLKHEYEPDNFKRHIILPHNADCIFLSARYEKGILHIYIPKSENIVENLAATVPVY